MIALALTLLAFAAPHPARVQVVADEYSFTLSRRTIKAGPAIIELANFGEDPHDLRMRRMAKGAPTLKIDTVPPGEQGYLRAKLAPGRFLLWCSIDDHREHGMHAILDREAGGRR